MEVNEDDELLEVCVAEVEDVGGDKGSSSSRRMTPKTASVAPPRAT
jgi:hypothetical protein